MKTARPALDEKPCHLREYLRVSKDPNGLETSPNEQHDAHIVDGERNAFTLHPTPYRDIGSASRHTKKARADFDKMMADLKEQKLDADGIAIWEPSRGSRRVWEWALLIDLLADQHLKVWVSTHGRFYDPRKPRDRRNLQEDAVDAEYESGKTSDRLIRSHAARARDGKAVGRISYGYRSAYDEANGKPLGRVLEPVEAKRIEELFEMFVKGKSISACQKDWAKKGIVNGVGKPFGGPQLTEMLRNRVYIAERVHVPGKVTRWWRVPLDEVEITEGQWPAIVSRDLFFSAQAILEDASRVTTRPGGARHFLSMIARCDKCSGPLCAGVRRGIWIYKCRDTGCAMVSQAEVDKFGEQLLLAWLSDREVYAHAKSDDAHADAELETARAELVEAREHHRGLMASAKARRISLTAFEELEPEAARDVAVLRARVRGLETPPVLRGLIEPGEDVAVRWADITDITVRRKIAERVLIPTRAGQLRIKPSPVRGHRVPIGNRVRVLKED